MFYVYVIKSRRDSRLYTGYTNDLRRRFLEHNGKIGRPSKSTKPRAPFDLLYYEAYVSQADAKQREHNLKHSAGARTALKRRIPNGLRSGHFV
ncbi:GIY-YIG nuclease family protein [Candidatus Kaiserbacteria bacterium]|nr:GIY-YIG nuclease family protein [Candidatus Kaiserbacteria bacterium]